jgi:virginiamycin B lyase
MRNVILRWTLPLCAAIAGNFLAISSSIAGSGTQISQAGIHTPNASPQSIALGPDGAIWYTELAANRIGRNLLNAYTTDFAVPSPAAFASGVAPSGITAGPDGAMWFTEPGANKIARITASDPATITEFPLPAGSGAPISIAPGSDGALWFTEDNANKIGRITTSGAITEFAVPTPASGPQGIAAGPDGALWFTEGNGNKIGRITTSGSINEFPLSTPNSRPFVITAGPDGAMWFTELSGDNVGRITVGPSPAITETTVPTVNAQPQGIATGSDGLLYFSESNSAKIGRITPGASPSITENLTHITGVPLGVSAGPFGTLYFANPDNAIGIILLPTGFFQIFVAGDGLGIVTGSAAHQPGITVVQCDGGAPCYASFPVGEVVTLTASATRGSIFLGWTSVPGGPACSGTDPCTFTVDANGGILTAAFRLSSSNEVISVINAGNGTGTVASSPSGISCGPTCNANFDRNVPIVLTATPASGSTFIGWSGGGCQGVGTCTVAPAAAATVTANYVLNTTSDVILVSALLPTSRAVHTGVSATVFATMINASADTAATNCTIAPTTSVPAATFSFQTTNSATNAPTGIPNTPVTIPPGGAQSFLLAFQTAQFLSSPVPLVAVPASFSGDVAFSFTCTNTTAAASVSGLNTLSLVSSINPTPDVIALAATASHDGIVDIPGTSGTGAFAVATANVGDAGTVTAYANGGFGILPVTVTICQTNPVTGQCLAPPLPQFQLTIAAGATPTFSVFVQAYGAVPFQPAANRISVGFITNQNKVGSTSVAVRTQ